MINKVS